MISKKNNFVQTFIFLGLLIIPLTLDAQNKGGLKIKIQPRILILCNSEVPQGVALAKAYSKMYQLEESVILSLKLPVDEKISMEVLKRDLLAPLKKEFELKGFPKNLLVVYGVPLFVQSEVSTRSIDPLISLMPRGAGLEDTFVANPCFRKKITYKKGAPILVCRLDAPSSKSAKKLLDSWALVHEFGFYGRFLFSDSKGKMAQSLKSHGVFVQKLNLKLLPPEDEIQGLFTKEKDLLKLYQNKTKLRSGALVLCSGEETGVSQKDVVFRSYGKTPASAAILMGAGFWLGSFSFEPPSEGSLFSGEHFLERLLYGESFAESSYGAMRFLGGGAMLIGDPLFRPYGAKTISELNNFFEKDDLKGSDDSYRQYYAKAKDLWLSEELLSEWHSGKINMAIGKAKGATYLRKNSPIFKEILCNFYEMSGQIEALKTELKKWNSLKDPPYYSEMKETYFKP